MAEAGGTTMPLHETENQTKLTATPKKSAEILDAITEEDITKLFPKNSPPLRRHWRALLATLSVTMGSCTIGTVVGYTSPAVPDINSSDPSNPFHLSATDIALMTSIIALGGILGLILGGILIDRFGRRMTLMASSVPAVVGWILIGCAPNVATIHVGRILTGLASGLAEAAIPIYISEISEQSVRGFLCSLHELLLNTGTLIVFSLGIVLRWHWLALTCIAFPVIMCASLVFVPESPQWLLGQGRSEDALKALLWLRGSSREEVDQEYRDMEENVRTNPMFIQWKELADPAFLRPVLITVALMFFQQMSGYGVFPEYMVSIFQAGKTNWNPYAQTAIVGATGVIANAISALVVDRAGRRTMLVVSASLMALGLAGLASFFTLIHYSSGEDPLLSSLGWLPVPCLILYNFAMSLGYGPIPYYLPSELLPLRGRGRFGSMSVASVWVFIFATTMTFEPLRRAISEFIIYWMFCGFAVLAVGFALVFVPETNGRSLEEIENRGTES